MDFFNIFLVSVEIVVLEVLFFFFDLLFRGWFYFEIFWKFVWFCRFLIICLVCEVWEEIREREKM